MNGQCRISTYSTRSCLATRSETSLLPLKFKLAVFHRDFDAVAGFELAVEQFHGQWVKQKFLDGAFERARAELRVVPLFGQIPPGCGIHLDGQLLLGQPLFQALQLNAYDRLKLFLVQAVENDDVVNPVQELGPEMFLQFRPDQFLDFRVVLPLPCTRTVVDIPG